MKNLSLLTLLAILLVSCAPGPTPAPVSTATNRPLPTATLTPEPTATPTPLILGSLNPYLVGVGEHGAMICLKPDDPTQSEQIVLTANISQDGKVLDRNVLAENKEENGLCFEVMDARYVLEKPVSVELNATATGVMVENGKQTVDVGNYGVLNQAGNLDHYPFLTYIYPVEIDSMHLVKIFIPGSCDEGFHPALDFSPNTNATYPDIQQIPVLSPVTGKVYQVGMDDPNLQGEQRVNNIIIESTYTGWLVTLGHLANRTPAGDYLNSYCSGEGQNLTWTNCQTSLKTFQHIGYMFVDPTDPWQGNTHIHLAVTNPAGQGVYTPGDLNNIDPTYLWLAPPDVPNLLDTAEIILKK
jgi:hypothetical protein